MRKIFNYLIFINIFFFNIVSSNESIYYIDIDFIINNSSAGKSIIKQLENKNKSYKDIFKKTEDNLKKEETNIISQKNILDKKEFEAKVSSFNQKVSLYQKKRKDTFDDFLKKKNIARKKLLEELTPILADYAEKQSISFILPKQNIVIGKSELDLTNNIIIILNKKIKTIKLK